MVLCTASSRRALDLFRTAASPNTESGGTAVLTTGTRRSSAWSMLLVMGRSVGKIWCPRWWCPRRRRTSKVGNYCFTPWRARAARSGTVWRGVLSFFDAASRRWRVAVNASRWRALRPRHAVDAMTLLTPSTRRGDGVEGSRTPSARRPRDRVRTAPRHSQMTPSRRRVASRLSRRRPRR